MKVLIAGLGLVLSMGIARADRPKVADDKPLEKDQQAPWDRGVTVEQMQAAAAVFDEANAQLDASLPAKAAEKYNEALKLWPHPMIHYNLALALIDLKRPVEVAEHLEKAIAYGAEGLNNQPEKLDQAKRLLEFTLDQLATVEVSCQKDGAKVSVDGQHVFTVEKGKLNLHRWRVEAGQHTFVAKKPGHPVVVRTPFVYPGEALLVELKLYTAEELTRYRRRWDLTWVPWVMLGGGVMVGAAGGALQLSAYSSYRKFEQDLRFCIRNGQPCREEEINRLSLKKGDTMRTFGIAGYSIAGVAILASSALLYLNRRTAYQIAPDDVSLAPLVGPGAGAMVMGRF